MLHCPNCNATNPDGTRYYKQCGVNLGNAAPKDRQGRPLYSSAPGQWLSRPVKRPRWLSGWRYDLLADVRGIALELGVHSGPNFAYYPPGVKVIATDVSAASLSGARQLFLRFAQGRAISIADAQNLPFADDSFDAVVSTLVFCSIPDPVRALGEVARILRPGGRFYSIDHVRAEQPVLGALMDALTPAWKVVADGCHLNRRTESTLRDAGFTIHEQRMALGGVLRWIISEPRR